MAALRRRRHQLRRHLRRATTTPTRSAPTTSATPITVVVTATNHGGRRDLRPRPPAGRGRDRAARHRRAGGRRDRRAGRTLTADDGTWSGTTPVDFTYQWQRCDADGTNCVDITGADRRHLHAGRRRPRPHRRGGRDRHQRRRHRHRDERAQRRAPGAAGQHDRRRRSRAPTELGEVLTADPGTWSGTGPLDYDVPVAALRLLRQQLRRHRRARPIDTYTLGTDDLGHTIKVVVTASNAAGSDSADAPTSAAVTDPTPTDPDPDPDAHAVAHAYADPDAEAHDRRCRAATHALAGPVVERRPRSAASAARTSAASPAASSATRAASSSLGNSKYRRVKAKGIGTIRVRAYANGPATKISPVLRHHADQPRQGQEGHLQARRPASSRPSARASLEGRDHAAEAAEVGIHMLKATVKGKKKKSKAKVVTLKLKTVPCKTLFTAQRWRTTPAPACGCASTRARRSAASRSRCQAAAAAPGQAAPHDRLHARVRRRRERPQRYSLKLAQEGQEEALVAGAGKPTVKLEGGKLSVTGLPARAAVVELTMYRVKKLDGATEAPRLQAAGARRAHGRRR